METDSAMTSLFPLGRDQDADSGSNTNVMPPGSSILDPPYQSGEVVSSGDVGDEGDTAKRNGSATSANDKVFPLFNLPREVRLHAFDLVVGAQLPLDYLAEMRRGLPLITAATRDAHQRNVSATCNLHLLLPVCRQMKAEATRSFYGTTQATIHRAVLRPHDVRMNGFQESLCYMDKVTLKDYPHWVVQQSPGALAIPVPRHRTTIDRDGNVIPSTTTTTLPPPPAIVPRFNQHGPTESNPNLIDRRDTLNRKVIRRTVRLVNQGEKGWAVQAHLTVELAGDGDQLHETEVPWPACQTTASATLASADLAAGLTMRLLYQLFVDMEDSPM